MKVLQLIDTLNAGGAERIAVNYANMLSRASIDSFLVTTRTTGILENELNEKVSYLNLNKKKTLDVKALKEFKQYLKNNDIRIVHAHTTSYFFAVLTRLFLPGLKIIWHDHHGNRANAKKRKQLPIIISSLFFDGVICVNETLLEWAKKKLFCKNVIYMQNFLSSNGVKDSKTVLHGAKGKRIVKIANLRPPKNHLTLLKAFKEVHLKHLDWTLHLVGEDYENAYSKIVHDFISDNKMQDAIFVYGLKNDIPHILSQASIGIIASTSEGLPMALLEYGHESLGIITTDVGKCGDLVKGRGIVLSDMHPTSMANAIDKMILDTELRAHYSKEIKEYIDENFTEKAISQKIILFYKNIVEPHH